MGKMREKYKSGELALLPEGVPKFLAGISDYRDLVFFTLATYAGIRRDDIVRLEASNFHPDEGKLPLS